MRYLTLLRSKAIRMVAVVCKMKSYDHCTLLYTAVGVYVIIIVDPVYSTVTTYYCQNNIFIVILTVYFSALISALVLLQVVQELETTPLLYMSRKSQGYFGWKQT